MTNNSPIKTLSRKLRLWFYHLRKGPNFYYHGVEIVLPDSLMFTFKRLIMKGRYEEAERRLIEKYMSPTLPVVELGGSLGVVSAFIGSRLRDGVPCRIVEANSAILDVCQRNANSARPSGESEVIHAAIAYGRERVSFAASENVHISKVGEAGEGHITVATTTLEEQVRAVRGLEGYTLVMDVEGMEYDVFEQEPEILSRCELAIVEFHPSVFESAGRTLEGFMSLVDKAGLKSLEVVDNSIALVRK